ncbi:MAG: PIG-L deacetylase family protein [Pseudomonadota bacterium]
MRLPRLRKKYLITLIPVLLLFFTVSFLAREYFANIYVGNIISEIDTPKAGDRLLVFAPHSDDESLGAATLIRKSIQNGARVKVVLVTNGDGFRRAVEIEYARLNPSPEEYVSFGYRRQAESKSALKSLGMKENDMMFLGYPDGGISKMWSSNWNINNPYFSKYTRTYNSPYKNNYGGKRLYAGENLLDDTKKIVEDFKPTVIVYPHSNDRHPDHWAVNAFVKYSLAAMNYAPEHEWLYLVHRGDWPTPLERKRNMYLTPPMSLLRTGTTWFSFSMNDSDIEKKSGTLKLYKSQVKRISHLMSAFERKNELFGEYPDMRLTAYTRSDPDILPDENNRVISDPVKDALGLEINPESDILAVHAENSMENNMHVFIVLDGKPAAKPVYYLNMVFFRPDGILPLSLEISNGELKAARYDENSIVGTEGISSTALGKSIHITISGDILGDYDKVFINAESSLGSLHMDRTAWRMLYAD